MPTARINDCGLYYTLHSPRHASQPALVLLHGLGSSSDDWELQVPAFGADRRLLLVDLRGHGRSGLGEGRLSVERMADDVAQLLQQLGVPPADVLGLSLGGCVAQALALRHPSRVRGLILVNTFARFRPAGWRGALRAALRLWMLATAPMPSIAAFVARGLFPRPDQQTLAQQAAQRLGRIPRANYAAAIRAIAAFDSRRQLPGIHCPALIIAGDRDQTVPRAAAHLLARAIPGAQLQLIPDSGHATPIDQPALFNQAVVEFLRLNQPPLT